MSDRHSREDSHAKIWRNRSVAYAFTIAVVAAIGLTFVNRTAIHRQLNDWKLLPQPERLTELYFTDHTKLPSTYTPGQTQTVAFTVHNLEYRATTYHYTILESTDPANPPAIENQLAKGSFVLAQNDSKELSMPVTLADLGRHVSVSVQLADQNESISYWLERER